MSSSISIIKDFALSAFPLGILDLLMLILSQNPLKTNEMAVPFLCIRQYIGSARRRMHGRVIMSSVVSKEIMNLWKIPFLRRFLSAWHSYWRIYTVQ